jgi:Mn2+/Fe2+ NRAMP family transporter
MSVSAQPISAARAPAALSFLKLAGPGLVVAATGIGSGDVVAATVGGARYGVVLLWAIAVGAFFKYVLNEGIARWQLATGRTALEGWAEYLPAWVKFYFGIYLVLWTVAVTAALTNATGLGIANLSGGRIAQSWGAVGHSLFGFIFVLLGGYGGFEKLMKTLVGVMGFSILVCAALTFHDPAGVMRGTLLPTIPGGAGLYVLSIIGGIGGSVTMLSYNYWMREEKLSGPEQLGYVRGDIAIAYLFTALFGMAIMMTANQAFFVPGVAITNAQAVPKMAEMLGSILGAFGRVAYSMGFWAAVFASLLGVWQSVPYLYADFYSIIKKMSPDERTRITKVTSKPYRLALLFVTLAPLPFAFTGQPIQVIVAYTIVGSLFVPFLAATLLYLNNRVTWKAAVPHNNWPTNALLIVILLLFAIVGGDEARRAIAPLLR